jgi:hypothetical protein
LGDGPYSFETSGDPPPAAAAVALDVLSTNNKQREDCLNTARVEPDGYMRAITLCLKGIDRMGDENANA